MMQEDRLNEVMTLADLAEYLHLSEKTLLRMCQKGEIPATKIASQWRFMRPVIRDWLAGQMQTMQSVELEGIAQHGREVLPLHELVRGDLVSMDIEPGAKEAVLKQLVGPLSNSGFARRPSVLLDGLMERERMMTTAVGHGIAMPHPRRPIAGMFPEPAVAVGICPEGANFEAVDDRLVHLFFLICSTREEIHLQLMAKVSWLCRRANTVAQLQQASSVKEVLDSVYSLSRGLD